MDRLKIHTLHLHNFKGVRDFTLGLAGGNAVILGNNGVGKTTLADAWAWLLYDKDSRGNSTFQLKTLDKDGQDIHNLEHSVEAEVECSDLVVSLKKVYREVYKKRRGQGGTDLTGHTTDHFVNEVPCSKKDYVGHLDRLGILGDKEMRLLTDPAYFSEALGWKDRRATLMEVCGGISDVEVVESEGPDAEWLLTLVRGGTSLDEATTLLSSQKRKLNKELDLLPVRIDEARGSLPDVDGDSSAGIAAGIIKASRAQRKALQQRLSEDRAGWVDHDRVDEVQGAITQLVDSKAETQRLAREASAANQANRVLALNSLAELDKVVNCGETTITEQTERMERLAAEDRAARASSFPKDSSECGACGQALPEGQVEQARVAFNSRKANELKQITEANEAAMQKRDDTALAVEDADRNRHKVRDKLDAMTTETDKAVAARSVAVTVIDNRIGELKAELATVRDHSVDHGKTEETTRSIARLDERILVAEKQLATMELADRTRRRIKELESEEANVSARFEETEARVIQLEGIVLEKIRRLEAGINDRFKLVRFKLFKQLVNGGIEECCETTVAGIPYGSGLNHGARIQAGVDIINTLQTLYNFIPPIWVDHGESVTSLPDMPGQALVLVVSEDHDTLTVISRD